MGSLCCKTATQREMYFRKQEGVKLGNEIPEMLFLLPVTSAATALPHTWLARCSQGLLLCSLHQEMKAGEVRLFCD